MLAEYFWAVVPALAAVVAKTVPKSYFLNFNTDNAFLWRVL